ncbi:MAG: DUF192 domain-containing protein [bacterium]|nr:DUF192 domain-containing protein [bacterium]
MKKTTHLLICLLLMAGCLHAEVKMIPLHIHSTQLTVELADTDAKREKGLMYRQSIPEDYGMLFLYKDEVQCAMWMKNTLIHLDLIYLNKNKQVVDIYVNVPPCKEDPCASYPTRVPAQYVLELKGNRSKELNLKIGDTIFFVLK